MYFSLLFWFYYSYACAIEDTVSLTVVITGGLTEYPPRYPYPATATVSVYGLQGWMEDLQPLNIGRFLHACSSYVSGGTRVRLDLESTGSSQGAQWEFFRAWEPNIRPVQCHLTINSCHNSCIFLIAKIQVFLVTGGYGSGYLDSTELYEPSVGGWVIAGAKLPRPMISLKAINIDDRVLIFGSLRLFYTWSLVS